jgi:flagellar biogenesis protein FliO
MKSILLTPFLTLLIFFNAFPLLAQSEHEVEPTSATQVEYPGIHPETYEDLTHIQNSAETESFTGKFMNMLFILALLVGFMILASMMLKKMTHSRVTQINEQSLIKVLEARTLSPKSMLYLLKVEGKQLLIAESHGAVTHLATFSERYHFNSDEDTDDTDRQG